MKTILTSLGIFILSIAIVFLFAAFVKFDLNPVNWEESSRFLVAFIGGLVGAIGGAIYAADKLGRLN